VLNAEEKPFVSLVGFPEDKAASVSAQLETRGIDHRVVSDGAGRAAKGLCIAYSGRRPELPASVAALLRAGHPVVLALETADTLLALQAGRLGVLDVFVLGGKLAPWESWLAIPTENAARLLWLSRSRSMQTVLDVLLRAASTDAPVLLRGESGTGKSVLAREIHASSARKDGPFVEVSCPSLPESLLGSELFGHMRGAFTGAVKDRVGRVEAAHGGTLFLDEIGELSPELQAKLLHFVQEHRFERVGESQARTSNVRIVAATNRDLQTEVDAGRFRLDLFYRLSVVDVRLPSLRQRPEDLPDLAERLVSKCALRLHRPVPTISDAALALLATHSWPGNVRELENELERAIVLCPGGEIEPGHLSERVQHARPNAPYLGGAFTIDAIEREHIARVLERADSFEAAAKELGIDDSTLWRKRKRMAEGGGARRASRGSNGDAVQSQQR
jgi:DNA-binding NtrC family response regulator